VGIGIGDGGFGLVYGSGSGYGYRQGWGTRVDERRRGVGGGAEERLRFEYLNLCGEMG
jgi:hypothetical protein